MIDRARIVGFEWRHGNARTSGDRHGVGQAEAEPLLLAEPLVVVEDRRHGLLEPRYHALGRTAKGRMLQPTFTLRGGGTLLRVISARDMSRKERKVDEQAAQAGA